MSSETMYRCDICRKVTGTNNMVHDLTISANLLPGHGVGTFTLLEHMGERVESFKARDCCASCYAMVAQHYAEFQHDLAIACAEEEKCPI